MKRIKINCGCGRIHDVKRDKEAPPGATSMGCNWCPDCEDTADDYYDEWYNYNETDYGDDPNQLMLFSITDNILKNKNELAL